MAFHLPSLDPKSSNNTPRSPFGPLSPSEHNSRKDPNRNTPSKFFSKKVEKTNEVISRKSIGVFPCVLGNVVDLLPKISSPTSAVINSALQLQSLVSPENSKSRGESSGWRMSFPFASPKALAETDQRRSLKLKPIAPLVDTDLTEKVHSLNLSFKKPTNLTPLSLMHKLKALDNPSTNSSIVPGSSTSTNANGKRASLAVPESGRDTDRSVYRESVRPSIGNIEDPMKDKMSLLNSQKIRKFSEDSDFGPRQPSITLEKEDALGHKISLDGGSSVIDDEKGNSKDQANLRPVTSSLELEKAMEKENSKKLFLPKFNKRNSKLNEGGLQRSLSEIKESASPLFEVTPQPDARPHINFYSAHAEDEESSVTLKVPRSETRKNSKTLSKHDSLIFPSENFERSSPKRFSMINKNPKDENFSKLILKQVEMRKSCLVLKVPSEVAVHVPPSKFSNRNKSAKKVRIVAVTKELKKLRSFLWAAVTPQLLVGEVTKTTEYHQRQLLAENIGKEIEQYTSTTIDFIKIYCSKALHDIYGEKKSMIVVSNEEKSFFGRKKLNAKDIGKRATVMKTRIVSLLEGMAEFIEETKFPAAITEFLFHISKENAAMPQNYLYPFEVSRLRFNRFGHLKNVTPAMSKMIIGMFFITRVLIYYFLVNPSTIMQNMPTKESAVKNLKSCSSVLYHIVQELYTENMEVVPRNQMLIHFRNRIQTVKTKLVGFGQEPDHIFKGDEIITGLYSKEQLGPFFDSQNNHIQDIKNAMKKVIDKLYSIVHH